MENKKTIVADFDINCRSSLLKKYLQERYGPDVVVISKSEAIDSSIRTTNVTYLYNTKYEDGGNSLRYFSGKQKRRLRRKKPKQN